MQQRLTEAELEELTQRKQRRAQIRVLQQLRIDHHVHPDGNPIVYWEDVRPWTRRSPRRRTEPDWSAMDG